MPNKNLSVEQTLRALRLSIFDGCFAHIYANLTGSVFLPAFALALNAGSLELGLLAAIPFFANVFQLFGAFLIEKKQKRKRLVILFAGLGRGMWIPIIIFSLLLSQSNPSSFLIFFAVLLAASHIATSIGGVSWLSWMSGLVPDEIRGRFFGLRNSILGIITVGITLLGGSFLDWFGQACPGLPPSRPFEVLFGVAVLAGAASLWFLALKPELPGMPGAYRKLKELYRAPLQHRDFRKFLGFAMLRSFATNIAAPFFVVFLLEDLKFSYTMVGVFTVLSAAADLTGMWVWGHLSDHLGNRPIIIGTALATTIIPALWIFASAEPFSVYFLIPLLHLSGGFFWAGYNLCAANLVYRMVPARGNSVYFAFWSIAGGVTAGLGSLAGGLLADYTDWLMGYLPFAFSSGYKLIFLISALLRVIPLFSIRAVREEQGMPFRHAVRVLGSIRSWATLMGFHSVLHFFLPPSPSPKKASLYWPIWRWQRPREAKRSEEV